MNPSHPLLMIPGPVEISARVAEAAAQRPLGHLDPEFVAAFGGALRALRAVWRASDDASPFVVPGGGTLAMESAATNVVAPGERALVVVTGYFGDRMAEMLRRRGAGVETVEASPGEAPAPDEVAAALARGRDAGRPFKALFATHVDTSTGVLVDPEPLARLAAEHDALSVFDGVCATAGERFEMAAWGADIYFTASQKALGLPAGLAVWMASARAMAARAALAAEPPMAGDWLAWQPVMAGYEGGAPRYYSTPPTTLVAALATGLAELLEEAPAADEAMARVWARHRRAAAALGAAWSALGLATVPARPELRAHTLSALGFPPGRGNELVGAIRARGVQVAGGLHSALAGTYFRVGHMGEVTRSREPLARTVRAIGEALDGDVAGALRAFDDAWARDAG
ncbi:MAG: alanine--glyoxylate aminotransferase family protein [Holophagales bacterium]|nr:alanine--glyoxylate aminotransferase family protein [Holophagales bacterium]